MPRRSVPDVRPEALVEELRRAAGRELSLPEILQRARIHPGALRAARKVMQRLVEDRAVVESRGRFAVPAPKAAPAAPAGRRARREPTTGSGAPVAQAGKGLVGLYTRHRDGFGFLARLDRQGPDLFVAPGDGGRAVDGDVVRFEIFPGRRGDQARITEVSEGGSVPDLRVVNKGDLWVDSACSRAERSSTPISWPWAPS